MKSFTKKEEQVLLAVFRLKDRACLHTIREEIKKYAGKSYSLGTVYAPLSRLDAYGYLRSYQKENDPSQAGKPVKYYRLTDSGFHALGRLKEQMEKMWGGIVLPSYRGLKRD
ncbi:MAG: PadR family transcriptional regulator [Candidatus Aminicenantes bacterium]|nr:PadR family transcriptional regulator [Candidatus Aminicenantes bacterium]